MSRMEIPTPHRFTHKRPTSTIVSGRKVSGAPTEVETGIPGLMTPGGTFIEETTYGTVEVMKDTIYLEAVDDDGTTRVVRAGDLLVHEDTDDVWKATAGPGNTWENPSLYAGGRKVKHHIEVTVERADPEDLVLA